MKGLSKVIVLSAVGVIAVNNHTNAQFHIEIEDNSSLVRVGMDPHPTDSSDIALAYTLIGAIDNNGIDSIRYVRDCWKRKANLNITKDKAYSSLEYLLSRYLDEQTTGIYIPCELLSDDLYDYFMANRCNRLKHYLTLKYELHNYHPRSIKEFVNQRTFYEDLLMFNDPKREFWDMTTDVISSIPLSDTSRVADIGCGFGFNSLKFRDKIGTNGVVYAIDTEESYIKHLQDFLEKNYINGIIPIVSKSDDITLQDSIDVVFMSSLYHIIYTWSRDDERSSFLKSIKRVLKQNGYLVIVDNVNQHGNELNNCHVSPKVVQAQLGYWGFRLVKEKQLSSQRYFQLYQHDDTYTPDNMVTETEQPILNITSHKSIVHIGSLDSYDITDRGIDAAKYVYDYMGNGDVSLADIAIEKYNELIPMENFGGEYSALQWLCEVRKAEPKDQAKLLQNRLARSFYHKMTDDSCKVIRYYLLHKYKLGNDSIRMLSDSILEKSGEVGRTHRSYLEDYILALNPKRSKWEHTDSIISHLELKDGETIADIGCGSGFFTDKFSSIVGKNGKVYAIEIKDEHISTLRNYLVQENIHNVSVIKGKENILELPERVDKMFMCSLYHVMYGVISDTDRDSYLKSLVKNLKPNGELIIVDNGPVDDETLPYHGPYITKELIEIQLKYYGFVLIDSYQVIPQRYMLKFKLSQ